MIVNRRFISESESSYCPELDTWCSSEQEESYSMSEISRCPIQNWNGVSVQNDIDAPVENLAVQFGSK
jgi:hypothetical protein